MLQTKSSLAISGFPSQFSSSTIRKKTRSFSNIFIGGVFVRSRSHRGENSTALRVPLAWCAITGNSLDGNSNSVTDLQTAAPHLDAPGKPRERRRVRPPTSLPRAGPVIPFRSFCFISPGMSEIIPMATTFVSVATKRTFVRRTIGWRAPPARTWTESNLQTR